MILNRTLQRNILLALQEVYPDSLLVEELPEFSHDRQFMGNLFYLQEHGLIIGDDIRQPGQCRSMVDTQITRKGLDFLADDGGLATLLGGITVRFYTSEIVEAVAASLEGAGMDNSLRRSAVNSLKSMAAEEMREVVVQLIHAGARENLGLFGAAGNNTEGGNGEQ